MRIAPSFCRHSRCSNRHRPSAPNRSNNCVRSNTVTRSLCAWLPNRFRQEWIRRKILRACRLPSQALSDEKYTVCLCIGNICSSPVVADDRPPASSPAAGLMSRSIPQALRQLSRRRSSGFPFDRERRVGRVRRTCASRAPNRGAGFRTVRRDSGHGPFESARIEIEQRVRRKLAHKVDLFFAVRRCRRGRARCRIQYYGGESDFRRVVELARLGVKNLVLRQRDIA